MFDTILSLILKVKELADRGVAGEREAAIQKLAALMKKYRIKPSDLENAEDVEVRFKYRTADEKILGVCLAQVCCGKREVPCRVLPRKTILIYMTKAQEKEWRQIYAHYAAVLRKDKAMFIAAFLHRNEIKPPPGGKRKQLSMTEMAALMKLMGYMTRSPYVKMSTMIGAYQDGP
jgi:hypothetical protein